LAVAGWASRIASLSDVKEAAAALLRLKRVVAACVSASVHGIGAAICLGHLVLIPLESDMSLEFVVVENLLLAIGQKTREPLPDA